MTAHRPLSRVVVLGRDADLWLCVNAISRALGDHVHLLLCCRYLGSYVLMIGPLADRGR